MSTVFRLNTSKTRFDTLEEARAAGVEYLNWLSITPSVFMQVKKCVKTADNSFSVPENFLTDEEILNSTEGVFLISGEINSELTEVTNLPEAVEYHKNLWIEATKANIVYEITTFVNEDGENDMTMTDYSIID